MLFIKAVNEALVVLNISDLLFIIHFKYGLLCFAGIDLQYHLLFLSDMLLQFLVILPIETFIQVELIKFCKGVITDMPKYLK